MVDYVFNANVFNKDGEHKFFCEYYSDEIAEPIFINQIKKELKSKYPLSEGFYISLVKHFPKTDKDELIPIS